MSATATYKDIGVSISGHVGQIEIQRPPHNYFDTALIKDGVKVWAERRLPNFEGR